MLKYLFLILMISVATQSEALLKLDLVDWKFSIPSKYNEVQYPAKIPSNIHIDLLENKLIEDPYYRNNQNNVTWIHNVEVIYETKFKLPAEFSGKYLELVFEGLDTYANITLNNQHIKSTNNSFIKFVIPVQNLKVNEDNVLKILFSPSEKIDGENQKAGPRLPFAYGHSRKAPYQYGWDWAPKMITVGIWRPAYILAFEKARIDYVWARNRVISNEKAIINFATVVHKNPSEMVSLAANKQTKYSINVLLDDTSLGSIECNDPQCYIDIEIPQPKLWWPRSVGTPNMYNFSVQLKHGNEILDSKKIPYGIRTVELNQTDGAFQFIVNGYPVYAKGGNYVPADMFHPRFANPAHNPIYTVQKMFADIAESNINMIRIWGGGQYETDQFYELASRHGIMLFSDFMFSVNTYPGSEHFLRNCEEEAKYQIRRLRNYPALALWSGNNEVLQGILSWGWGSEQQRKFYDLLFEKLLRRIIEIENPDISYIPSSPNFGSGYDTSKGDIHSWSVWAAGSEFESYLTTVGRFNSQFGTQAFPVWQTVKSFTLEEDRNYESAVMRGHEKHNSQFNHLKKYHTQYFRPSNSFENEVYVSGLTQAYAIRLAIAAHRVNKQKTWGTLYWQLNDAWPVISWAAIDFYGRWKPLQYLAKNYFKDVALFIQSFDNSGKTIKYVAVNDKLQQMKTLVRIKILTFDGEVLYNDTKVVDLKPNEAKVIEQFQNSAATLKGKNASEVVFFGQIVSSKTNTMTNTYYIGRPKDIQLKAAKLSVSYNTDTNQIKLSTNSLIKSLYISHPDEYIKLSDNYVDILPGIQTVVELPNLSGLKDKLQFKSVLQSYSNTPLTVNVV